MRFHGAGSFLAAAVDVDPVAAPETILTNHFMSPKSHATKIPTALHLALLGTGAETLTLDLYYLVADQDDGKKALDYKIAATRWIKFDTGVVVTNAVQSRMVDDLPAGGIIYARRTADTLTGGQTRQLMFAWS